MSGCMRSIARPSPSYALRTPFMSEKGNGSLEGGLGTAHTQFSDCASPHVVDVEYVLFLLIYRLRADTLSVEPIMVRGIL